jgi:hypothetical protein
MVELRISKLREGSLFPLLPEAAPAGGQGVPRLTSGRPADAKEALNCRKVGRRRSAAM